MTTGLPIRRFVCTCKQRMNLSLTWMQTNNFLRIAGVNLAKLAGVAIEASRMNTSPATPVCSSFSLISPIINTSLMMSLALKFNSLPVEEAFITVKRRPLEVRPGKGGMCLQVQGPEEHH